jgi:hypothetical protein
MLVVEYSMVRDMIDKWDKQLAAIGFRSDVNTEVFKELLDVQQAMVNDKYELIQASTSKD